MRIEAASLRADDSTAPVQCCIAGSGPVGMMLGLLLARADVSVVVLEKHADFLRDFRGDTIQAPVRPAFVVRLLNRVPWLRRIPGLLVGIGVRPEHVQVPLDEHGDPRLVVA